MATGRQVGTCHLCSALPTGGLLAAPTLEMQAFIRETIVSKVKVSAICFKCHQGVLSFQAHIASVTTFFRLFNNPGPQKCVICWGTDATIKLVANQREFLAHKYLINLEDEAKICRRCIEIITEHESNCSWWESKSGEYAVTLQEISSSIETLSIQR